MCEAGAAGSVMDALVVLGALLCASSVFTFSAYGIHTVFF